MTTNTHTGAPANQLGLLARYRRLYSVSGTGERPRVPHPGDILFWVTCLGAVSFLLFVATK